MSLLSSFIEMITTAAGNSEAEKQDSAAMKLAREQRQRGIWAARAQQVDALSRGEMRAGQAQMQGARVQGKQRVAYAAGSIDSSSGTAALVQSSTGLYSELDAQMLRSNARREAQGFESVEQGIVFDGQREEDAYGARIKGRDLSFVNSWAKFGTSILSSGIGGM